MKTNPWRLVSMASETWLFLELYVPSPHRLPRLPQGPQEPQWLPVLPPLPKGCTELVPNAED